MPTTATHCPYCALQCGMNLVERDSELTVAARPDFPTNKGGLCQKGWTSADLLRHPERLKTPLMRDRKGDPLRPVSWDVALDRTAREIVAVQEKYGRDAVGVFGGGGLTNEKAYTLGKFARVGLRTAMIDYNGRFCMSSAAAAGIKALGVDRGMPFPLEDIPGAEVILLIGSNAAETMPPIMQYFEAQRQRGGKLIVVDPRWTPTAQSATLHLQITPGTDLALANGLLHIAARDNLLDMEFIKTRTTNFPALSRVLASCWPEHIERITGVSMQQMTRAAHLLGNAKSAMILTARGAEQQSKGTDTVLAFINLILALGKVGKPHCGYGCLTGQGNGQGGREHGQKADQLPGYRNIDDPEHRAHVAQVWGIAPEDLPGPGKSAYEMLDTMGMEGGVRALLVVASNIAVSSPRARHIQERMDALDFLMVSDIFLSESAQRADVVFPTTQWAEEEGTMTNLEGRVLRRKQAMAPPEGVRSDLEMLKGLAERLGRGEFFSSDPQIVFTELRQASAGGVADYAGITYDRIEAEDGVFWPCPSEAHPGTPRLFQDSFPTADGRARFHPVTYRPAAEEPTPDYPLYLTTGRIMAHYQSGTQSRRVKALRDMAPQAFVELHPDLAKRLGIENGDPVQVATRRGTADLKAAITPTIRPDTLFVPFHWGDASCANLLTNPALDPTSRMPEFKICAARIALAHP
ncbi:MAG: molybdopterin oxidoreductase [Chthonomonadaceae bacterium]|nr:molybdopterin oxidoreductase [Chthonomonadaceae bacterium]